MIDESRLYVTIFGEEIYAIYIQVRKDVCIGEKLILEWLSKTSFFGYFIDNYHD